MDVGYLFAYGNASPRCNAERRSGFARRLAEIDEGGKTTGIGRVCKNGGEMVAVSFGRGEAVVALLFE